MCVCGRVHSMPVCACTPAIVSYTSHVCGAQWRVCVRVRTAPLAIALPLVDRARVARSVFVLPDLEYFRLLFCTPYLVWLLPCDSRAQVLYRA